MDKKGMKLSDNLIASLDKALLNEPNEGARKIIEEIKKLAEDLKDSFESDKL